LQATGQLGSMNFMQAAVSQGFYGFRAATGSSMVTEPYITNLVATGHMADLTGLYHGSFEVK
jgi:hypothetical protein